MLREHTIQLRREDLVAWGYTTVRLSPIHFDKDTFAIAGFGNILTYCAKKITITEEDFNNAINQS